MPAIRTVDTVTTVELDRVKGSRFVGLLAPATSETAAMAVLAQCRNDEPDASHHCWAWRLADGRERADDDGEPRDTAGTPILRHLGGADLVDVTVVVMRWFGGTKLGRGGLIRAYGDAAALAIEEASIIQRPVVRRLRLHHPYDLQGVVDGCIAGHGVRVVASDYGIRVDLTVEVLAEAHDEFVAALGEATSGRVTTVDG